AAEISAQFDPATDMVVALQQVQNRIAEARQDMPPDLELVVDRLMPTSFPFFSIDITGGLGSADLRDFGFFVVRPALSRVGGVGRVEVLSTDEREVEVVTDPARLSASGLTVADVAASLKAANVLTPVGRLSQSEQQHLLIASAQWT